MQITYQAKPSTASAVIAVLVPEGGKLGARALVLDTQLNGAIARAITAPAFKAKREQIIELIAPAKDGPRRVLIAGAGAPKELNARNARSLGGAIAARLMAAHEPEADVLVDLPKGTPLGEGELAANLALGIRLRNYHFGKYLTKAKP